MESLIYRVWRVFFFFFPINEWNDVCYIIGGACGWVT